jgi:hypothetical protein
LKERKKTGPSFVNFFRNVGFGQKFTRAIRSLETGPTDRGMSGEVLKTTNQHFDN